MGRSLRTVRNLSALATVVWVAFGTCATAQDIWFTGRPRAMDYMELFRAGAPWNQAASIVRVFGISIQMETDAPDMDLRTIFSALDRRDVGLILDMLPLSAGGNGCGFRVEGYSSPGQTITVARRIRSLGGNPQYYSLDEPLWFGHAFNGGSGLFPCHSSIIEVASQVADKVRQVRSIFPNVKIGDVEPVMALSQETWLADLEAWLDAYRSATGENLAFFRVDNDWHTSWTPRLKHIAAVLRARGIPLQIIYNGTGRDHSDTEWISSAEHHYRAVETNGIIPDVAAFQSWMSHPERMLPDTDPLTMTGLINRDAAWRRSREWLAY
jgi:hypothetical protein